MRAAPAREEEGSAPGRPKRAGDHSAGQGGEGGTQGGKAEEPGSSSGGEQEPVGMRCAPGKAGAGKRRSQPSAWGGDPAVINGLTVLIGSGFLGDIMVDSTKNRPWIYRPGLRGAEAYLDERRGGLGGGHTGPVGEAGRQQRWRRQRRLLCHEQCFSCIWAQLELRKNLGGQRGREDIGSLTPSMPGLHCHQRGWCVLPWSWSWPGERPGQQGREPGRWAPGGHSTDHGACLPAAARSGVAEAAVGQPGPAPLSSSPLGNKQLAPGLLRR